MSRFSLDFNQPFVDAFKDMHAALDVKDKHVMGVEDEAEKVEVSRRESERFQAIEEAQKVIERLLAAGTVVVSESKQANLIGIHFKGSFDNELRVLRKGIESLVRQAWLKESLRVLLIMRGEMPGLEWKKLPTKTLEEYYARCQEILGAVESGEVKLRDMDTKAAFGFTDEQQQAITLDELRDVMSQVQVFLYEQKQSGGE